MLKAEIDGEGVPEKGTPQGGLLSPLLSLIVLNELDWWVSSQWETFQPKNRSKNGWLQYAKKYTKLKSGFIVRYADDFKIMCSTYGEAQRFYHSTVDFLNKRLKLEISPEKSKVVNLKKNSSDFLGFKIKVISTPGHTEGGCCYYFDGNKVLASGDTLFCGSVGRTDFKGGSMSDLVRSVKEKLFKLPNDTAVLPGHEARTTIGYEKQYNMYLA